MQQVLIILVMFFSTLMFGQNSMTTDASEGVAIDVSVVNVLSDEGKVHFALFTKENFMTGNPVAAKSSTVKEGISAVKFDSIAPGEYAIICFHDKNENNRMDFQENGMPLESYGTSNNVYLMGPPEFESAKFEVKKETLKLEIKF